MRKRDIERAANILESMQFECGTIDKCTPSGRLDDRADARRIAHEIWDQNVGGTDVGFVDALTDLVYSLRRDHQITRDVLNAVRDALGTPEDADVLKHAKKLRMGQESPAAHCEHPDNRECDVTCVWCVAAGQKLERENVVAYLRDHGEESAADHIEDGAHLESEEPTEQESEERGDK